MLNLDKTTEILLKHYNIWINNSKVEEIKIYNNHKIRHSIWVLEYGRLILLRMDNLSSEEKNRAEVAFLLHDLWRFYQNNWEKILSNTIFEHADAWYNIAKKEWYPEAICLAIKYHNKKSIELLYEEKWYINLDEKEKEKTDFLVKITRDADKLENMIYSIYNINHLLLLDKFNKTNTKRWITKECLDDVLSKKLIDRKHIKTYIDRILVLLSWVFDINFKQTKEILIENNYLEKIKEILEDSLIEEEFKKLEKVFEICNLELNK